jgi:ABC-type sugar transport system ATPase subunit
MNNSEFPALDLAGIDLHYGFVKALHDIDFNVATGEVVALLGDNGAGKSTLLKLMSGTIRPTEGVIRRSGREVHFHSPSDAAAAGVQMVYQDLALVDPLDIATNLCIGREIVRKGPLGLLGVLDRGAMRREAVSELESLGVKIANMNRPVEMLSGGQRQVVALARSAVRVSTAHQGVLLLDEPTAALGYEQTQQVRDLIGRLAAREIGIVLVTHNLGLAFDVADRIVVLNRGQKVADVAVNETEMDAVVGWITGARPAQPDLLERRALRYTGAQAGS